MVEKTGPDSLTLTYDLLKWSIPAIKKFPRDQRFMLGDRIENHILDVLELLISARYSRDKINYLKKSQPQNRGVALPLASFPGYEVSEQQEI